MQWLFLVIGLLAAIAELHATTFYLSAVAIAAIATAVAGTWLAHGWLPLLFAAIAIALLPVALVLRRRLARTGPVLPDPDVGQIVTIVEVGPEARLSVSYRGSRWAAVMESGIPPSPGEVAIIARKSDKLLHLIVPDAAHAAP